MTTTRTMTIIHQTRRTLSMRSWLNANAIQRSSIPPDSHHRSFAHDAFRIIRGAAVTIIGFQPKRRENQRSAIGEAGRKEPLPGQHLMQEDTCDAYQRGRWPSVEILSRLITSGMCLTLLNDVLHQMWQIYCGGYGVLLRMRHRGICTSSNEGIHTIEGALAVS